MSRRGLLPVALAVGFGVANGYIIFNPAFEQIEIDKVRDKEALEAADLGPNMIEIPIKDKGQTGNMPATTIDTKDVKENETAGSVEPGGESRWSSWWPFGGQSR